MHAVDKRLRSSMLFAISVIGMVGLMKPALADRPGTPNQPYLNVCGSRPVDHRPNLCGGFTNTAATDEEVIFEMELTRNDAPFSWPVECNDNPSQCWHPGKETYVNVPRNAGPRCNVVGCHYGKQPGRPIHELRFALNGLYFNEKYCARFRARRVSDQMVSQIWSGWACTQTPAPEAPATAQAPVPPPVPQKPIKHIAHGGDGRVVDPASAPRAAVLSCQGGGAMQVTSNTEAGALVAFTPASQAANVAAPGPGQCAWADRPVGANEQHRFALTPNKPNMRELLRAVQGGTFQVTAVPMTAFIMVTAINNVQVSGGGRSSPSPSNVGAGSTPSSPGAGNVGSCGAGTATVVINQPGLDKLNVRSGPDGQVTGTVPEGETVSVTGQCGQTAGAAGLVAEKSNGGDSGWCRISAPVSGCVKAQFLKTGGGAVGFARPKRN